MFALPESTNSAIELEPLADLEEIMQRDEKMGRMLDVLDELKKPIGKPLDMNESMVQQFDWDKNSVKFVHWNTE